MADTVLMPAQAKLARLIEEIVDPWDIPPEPQALVVMLVNHKEWPKLIGELQTELLKINIAKFFEGLAANIDPTKQTPEERKSPGQ